MRFKVYLFWAVARLPLAARPRPAAWPRPCRRTRGTAAIPKFTSDGHRKCLLDKLKMLFSCTNV